MKTILLWLSLLVLPATITSARLGETWGQCAARYGKPVMVQKRLGVFQKDGVRIEITFNGSSDRDSASDDAANHGITGPPGTAIAVEINYTKQAKDDYFTEAEVKLLMDANAGPESPLGDQAWTEDRVKNAHEDFLRADNLAKAKIYWIFTGNTKAARRLDFLLSDHPFEKHAPPPGDKPAPIEKGF